MKVIFSTSALLLLASAAMAQFNAAEFPEGNVVPPVDSPQMKEWLKDLNFAD
ncbi:hypothetical protein BGZ94_005436, partial [Podila epigama]